MTDTSLVGRKVKCVSYYPGYKIGKIYEITEYRGRGRDTRVYTRDEDGNEDWFYLRGAWREFFELIEEDETVEKEYLSMSTEDLVGKRLECIKPHGCFYVGKTYVVEKKDSDKNKVWIRDAEGDLDWFFVDSKEVYDVWKYFKLVEESISTPVIDSDKSIEEIITQAVELAKESAIQAIRGKGLRYDDAYQELNITSEKYISTDKATYWTALAVRNRLEDEKSVIRGVLDNFVMPQTNAQAEQRVKDLKEVLGIEEE